jgi:hypothetical protein
MAIIRRHVMIIIYAFDYCTRAQQTLVAFIFQLAGVGSPKVGVIVTFLFFDVHGVTQPQICLRMKAHDIVP